LTTWVRRVQDTWPRQDVYAYFNNDPNGAAVSDAQTFARLARTSGLTVTRTQLGARG
ncbi:DUF72 domain-containing protein, partial [Streptomyces sp. NPDC058964]